ncbi:MAG TPA: hypothetical protein VFW83_11505 [Bryobacteraceae bacterium]|nr:hypothetical protein [Bryobacteraceae bacterium]
MRTLRQGLIWSLLIIPALAGAQNARTFTGVLTDSECPTADHSRMQMGPTDAECTRACVRVHGATYVLYDGKKAYTLSGSKALDQFAGQKVTVRGALNAKTLTIQVASVAAAK